MLTHTPIIESLSISVTLFTTYIYVAVLNTAPVGLQVTQTLNNSEPVQTKIDFP